MNGFANVVLKIFGIEAVHGADVHSSDELKYLIKQSNESGTIVNTNYEIIRNAFDFGDRTVKQIMVPRSQVTAIDINRFDDNVLNKIIEDGYSRIPCFENNIDNVIGLIYIKDMLAKRNADVSIDIKSLIRPVILTLETRKIGSLMKEFQQKHIQLAIVVDEFGGMEGIVTVEDIVEEWVGEIQDEYDNEIPFVVKKDEKTYDVMISTKHPVTIQLEKIRRRTALILMLEQVHLTWDVRDGNLLLTTPSALSNSLLLRTFPVSDLLTPSDSKPGDSLVGLLMNTVAPASWDKNGGNGRIEFIPKTESLKVRQTSEHLAEIDRSLAELRSYVQLNRPITISFEATPLREAVERLSKLSGARLYLDPLGLNEVGVQPDMPVTLDAKDLRFHAALMQILEPFHLSYRKESADEIVRITSSRKARLS